MTDYAMPPVPAANMWWEAGNDGFQLKVTLLQERKILWFDRPREWGSRFVRWNHDPEKNAQNAIEAAEEILKGYERMKHDLNGLTGYTRGGVHF